MLNFKYLKKGEAQVIIDNLNTDGAIKHNCICLNNTDTILLRTNGSVIYGEYKEGDHRVKFTHSPQYALPYIAKDDYMMYKNVILSEWKKAYTPEAKAKMREVRMLIAHVMKNKEQQVFVMQEPVIQEPIFTQIEEKKEVKEMNKLTIMGLAHLIRRELNLEGHYHAQMKIAMKYAWAIKKNQTTLEELLNTTTTIEATAPTYNVANETKEEAPIVEDKPKTIQKPVTTTGLTIYLDKLENGIAYFNKAANGAHAPFFRFAARNMINMDKTFAKDWLPKIVNGLPNNSVVYFYGDYTEMTYLNNEAIRSLADSKSIKFERGLYGVAPSGIA